MSSYKKKIGIACGCRKLNYGSVLQSYALCNVINNLGYDCNFVWINGSFLKHYNIRFEKVAGVIFNSIKHPTLIPKVIRSFNRVFLNKTHYSISSDSKTKFEAFTQKMDIRVYNRKELAKKQFEYYKFVCGSDQIWNSYEYYLDPMYFLRFTERNKRIAYAPSFGTNTVSYYNRNTIKKYLRGFKRISVRESSGQHICRELVNRNVPVVLDPTLLMDNEQWINNLELKKDTQEYCFVYFLNKPCPSAVKAIDRMRENMRIVALPIKYEEFKDNEVVDAGPKEFLNYLYNAKYVLTDSFHGTIFSINFNKQFLTFDRQYASQTTQSSRITDILERLGLKDRFITRDMDEIFHNTINYEIVNSKLNLLRKKSLNYLKKALD